MMMVACIVGLGKVDLRGWLGKRLDETAKAEKVKHLRDIFSHCPAVIKRDFESAIV